ncbi:hypothetical protein H696_00506 [Fonticula alba]|uniref:Mre11 DNA-binding domain-containing protein n=1 Tax=Fonticula alba TaxID=691883 RepID=A0A058ZHJ1_FONAL|nr:hypothetical protein H696_00506 [Fonticula alba]KCV72952.1 hypothetical protein H696_00506 [Fonticula alba]|eukprot:XP_009492653.1 hypothetical protein H696_00506 [Fonticula alba]
MADPDTGEHDFRLFPVVLKTVRPMAIEDEDVSDRPPEDRDAIMEHLKQRVNDLIRQAHREWLERNPDDVGDPPRPLIRLRVTIGDKHLFNVFRFGQQFANSVANPSNIIQLTTKRRAATRAKRNVAAMRARSGAGASTAEPVFDEESLRPAELDPSSIKDFLRTILLPAGAAVAAGAGAGPSDTRSLFGFAFRRAG